MNELDMVLARIRESHREIRKLPSEQNDYECPKCRDTGWIRFEDEQGRSYMKHCECWALMESRRLLEKSGISTEFQKKGFKSFDTRNHPQLINAKNKAVGYLKTFEQCEKNRHNSIMFCGQVGAGKTHLGIAICSNLMSQNIAVYYMAYRNAVTKIKQVMTDEEMYNRELQRYMQARVLYIDDLLKGRITESDVNILYEIVNYRYMNNLPLIISTEKSIDDLLDFDEAIGSRMIEMCRGNIIQFQGKELNYRLV